MLNNEHPEVPELGDYSREEFVLREQQKEQEPEDDMANMLETQAKTDPILTMKHYLAEAKDVLAKLV